MVASSVPSSRAKRGSVEGAKEYLWLYTPKFIALKGGYSIYADLPEEMYERNAARIHQDPLFRRAVEDKTADVFSKGKLDWPRRMWFDWRDDRWMLDVDGDACGVGYFYTDYNPKITDHNIDTWGQASALFIGTTVYLRHLYTAMAARDSGAEHDLDAQLGAMLRSEGSRSIRVGEGSDLYLDRIERGREAPMPLSDYGLATDRRGLEALGSYMPMVRKTEDGFSIDARLLDTDEDDPGRRFRSKGYMDYYEGRLRGSFEEFFGGTFDPKTLEVRYGTEGVALSIDDSAVVYPVRSGSRISYESRDVKTLTEASVLLVSLANHLEHAFLQPRGEDLAGKAEEPCFVIINL